jgi:hypothetical protein
VIRRHIHQFSNLEFDWLACDADGFVAMFSSAGFGAVPEESAVAPEALDAALDRIEALPVTGEATSIGGTTNPDDWIAAAERGFFAFDWAHMRDRYELEALPSKPIHIDEIPDVVIRDITPRVRIPVRFSQLRWVDWDDDGQLSSG